MKNKLFMFFVCLLCTFALHAQGFSLTDTTLIFKDTTGNILEKPDLYAIVKNPFSIQKESLPNGKTSITIRPILSGDENEIKRLESLESWKKAIINSKLPDFSFLDINGNRVESADFQGKVLVLNFWFVGCSPCIREMPELNKLVNDYKNKNVVFIAPALDESDVINKLLNKKAFSYVLIPNAGDFSKQLKIQSYPVNMVVDQKGVIRYVYSGYNENIKSEMTKVIEKLLAER